jgi:hypothetical protein
MVLPRRAKVQARQGYHAHPLQQVTVQAPPVSHPPLHKSQVAVAHPPQVTAVGSPPHLICTVQIRLHMQESVTAPTTPERPSLLRERNVSRFRVSFFIFFFN